MDQDQSHTYPIASDRVFDLVSSEIHRGVLAPGELLTERELARRYEVSRTPVREALVRLEKSNWVARDGRGRVIVAAPKVEQLVDDMIAREALEGMAARLAADRLTPSFEISLSLLHDQIGQALDDGELVRAIELSSEWHRLIWRTAGSTTILRFLEEIETARGGRFRRSGLNDPERQVSGQKEHQEIVDALLAGNATAAEDAMRSHIRNGLKVRIALFMDRHADS